ncbi:serine O-acetyltransferase [Solibacillus sp. NPDC093137]|uniref:serine O-acetyltransferase n=1 Tax=Solibacillus sp. NPDC093137 TaxID=3390678 RepID=UPI003D050CEC
MKKSAVVRYNMLAQKLHSKKIPFLPKVIQNINRIVFSCDIPYTTEIPHSVKFGHNALGVVIHPKTKIGENSLIMQHVTLGGNLNKKRIHNGQELTSPIIGENVFIGPGAKILGPVIIGNNAQIGANSVVLKDIPQNGVAAGIPAKIIKILE